MNHDLAPVVLFVYNRLEHTKKTVGALQNNFLAKESELIIFSDGSKDEISEKDISKVRRFLREIDGFKDVKIVERDKNFGLAQSIIEGVTGIVNQYGKIIVLEDDIITSPYFLQFMNEALQIYEKEEKVVSIHGYVYPVKESLPETFFLQGADCWGWATWKRGWELLETDGKKLLQGLKEKKLMNRFDFDGAARYSTMLNNQIAGKNDSWAVRWYASALINDKVTLYPGRPLVENIGIDSSGTHCVKTDIYNNVLENNPVSINTIPIEENKKAYESFRSFFLLPQRSFLNKILSSAKILLNRI